MGNRVKEMRLALGLSQEEIAQRLGVTRGAISRIETGTTNLTPAMARSLCREFSVNEDWLLNGNGDMFLEMSRAELAANIVGNALNTNDDFILNTFIALGQLTPAEWEVVKKFVEKIKGN